MNLIGAGIVAAARVGAPAPLERALAGLREYGWEDLAWSLVVLCAAWVLGRVGAVVLLRLMSRWSRRTTSALDDIVVERLRRPLTFLVPILAVRLAVPLTSAPASVASPVQHVLLVAALVGAAWIVHATIRIVESAIETRLDLGANDNLRARQVVTSTRGLRNIADFAVFVLTAGFVLMTFDSVRQIGGTVLASAGVAGLIIGFAAQRSIATVLGGVQIALTQPIRVDDVVVVEGEWGRIEEITLTYAVIKIWDLRRLVVPISYFLEKPFQNWTRASAELLGVVELHLDFNVPVDELRAELVRILAASDKWDRKVANVQVTGTTERTMTVRPLFSAKNSSDQWDLRCEVREKLIAFVRQNYPRAFPRLRADVEGSDALPAALQPPSRSAG